jgi:hypothetical protein
MKEIADESIIILYQGFLLPQSITADIMKTIKEIKAENETPTASPKL